MQSAQGTRSVTSTDAQPPERPATAAAVPSHGTGGTRVTASQPVQPEAAPRIRMEDFQSILSGLSGESVLWNILSLLAVKRCYINLPWLNEIGGVQYTLTR